MADPAVLPAPADSAASAAPVGPLRYGEDARGKFAIYPLHAGEALYSSVVIRFTGRLHAPRVVGRQRHRRPQRHCRCHQYSDRLSGADSVRGLAAGVPACERPAAARVRSRAPPVGAVQERGESARARWRDGDPRRRPWWYRCRGLDGWSLGEPLRLRHRTAGQEDPRNRDAGEGGDDHARRRGVDHPRSRRPAVFTRATAVLTTPPFPITDTIVGVNLRWYLANSRYRHAKSSGSSSDKVVFLLIHADSLHPTLRGATAYIPDAGGTAGTARKTGAAFSARKEVKEQPEVSFSLQERQRSEGLSRDLAERIIASFKQERLGIHPFKPVRDRIFRGRRAWVPAGPALQRRAGEAPPRGMQSRQRRGPGIAHHARLPAARGSLSGRRVVELLRRSQVGAVASSAGCRRRRRSRRCYRDW